MDQDDDFLRLSSGGEVLEVVLEVSNAAYSISERHSADHVSLLT